MPTYNIMTWNIWQTGYKDYGKLSRNYDRTVNNQNMLNYTASAIAQSGANIAVLQETYNQAAPPIYFNLCEALRRLTDREWFYLPPITAALGGNSECYGFFWRQGDGFEPVIDPTKPVPLAGSLSTTNAVCTLASNPFPGNDGQYSQQRTRRAALAVFRNAGGNLVLVTNYHAPSKAPGSTIGLTAVAAMPELQGYQGQPYAAVFLCGDYNVDITTAAGQNAYQANLMAPTGTVPAISTLTLQNLDEIKTSLRQNEGAILAQPQDTLAYRSSGYDNIFHRNNLPIAVAGNVVNLLAYNQQMGALGFFANSYRLQSNNGAPAFEYANTFAGPIDTSYRSFLLTRYAISDHLPVNLAVTVP